MKGRIVLSTLLLLSSASCVDQAEVFFEERSQPIINGSTAESEEYDGVVNLYFKNIPLRDLAKIYPDIPLTEPDRTIDMSFCTGTLINERTVLTAGHCTYEAEKYDLSRYLQIRVGTVASEVPQERQYEVESIHTHPDYVNEADGSKLRHDIAILKLKRSVRDVAFFSVAHGETALKSKIIAKKEANFSYPEKMVARKFPVSAVGFGVDYVSEEESSGSGVRRVTSDGMTVYSYCSGNNEEDDICLINYGDVIRDGISEELYQAIKSDPSLSPMLDMDMELQEHILFSQLYHTGTCSGDSGGPLFAMLNHRRYVVGVASFVVGECNLFGGHVATWPYWESFIKPYFEQEICDNQKDEDNDGKIDCEDTDCGNANECKAEVCDNGIDDNGNGQTDCADASCVDFVKCKAEVCDNGMDDNGNGQTDCADASCVDFVKCKAEVCDNGMDDNGNGLTDCADPKCESHRQCIKDPCVKDGKIDCGNPACESRKKCQREICNNGIDDNDDGKTDDRDEACPKVSSSCSVGAFGRSSDNGTLLMAALSLFSFLFLRKRRRMSAHHVTK